MLKAVISFLTLFLLSWPTDARESEFKLVPKGVLNPFWLKPQKKESTTYKISAIFVQTHQVTNEQFIEFLKTNPQWRKSQVSPLMADQAYLTHFREDLILNPPHKPLSPVTSVSWFAARAYCESIGARLPTVQEWEYFAAASEKKSDANKDPSFLARILTWYGEPKPEALSPVKSIYKNLYGLHDLHGLVWEWVEDFNSNTMTGESREDSSLDRNLFCGGGSIDAGDKENYAAFMRFAFRGSLKGNSSIWNLGFRCVKGSSK